MAKGGYFQNTPLRSKICQKIADFTENSGILLAIFSNFGNLRLTIDYLGLNKPDKPVNSLLDPLISEKTAILVAIFVRHLNLKIRPGNFWKYHLHPLTFT